MTLFTTAAEVLKAMATQKKIKAVIQFRRGLESEWIAADPVLSLGEPAYSVDVGKLKVGNGSFRWSELAYIGSGSSIDIDDEISPISTNPVQNKVIAEALQEIEDEIGTIKTQVMFGTKDFWDSQPELIGRDNAIYVYTDALSKDYKNIARFKVGDGQTLLKDISFMDMIYYDHISDPLIHVSGEDREFWNNKVSCYNDGEKLIFTTGRI